LSDVFDEIISKLKQKAFQYYELPQWILRRHEWVKLEDVKEAIQQIKQSLLARIEELRDPNPGIPDNYPITKNQAYIIGWNEALTMIEELLQENEG